MSAKHINFKKQLFNKDKVLSIKSINLNQPKISSWQGLKLELIRSIKCASLYKNVPMPLTSMSQIITTLKIKIIPSFCYNKIKGPTP